MIMSANRRRSNTIEADTYEDFLRISIEGAPAPRSSSLPTIPISERSQYCSQLQIPCSSRILEQGKTDSFWEDFEYQGSPPEVSHDTNAMFVNKKSKSEGHFYMGNVQEQDDSAGLRVKQFKVMLIGAQDTGRHMFINSLFDKSNNQDMKVPNALDLMIKRQTTKDQLNLFKFWIKDANIHSFDLLLKVHFRTIKSYIFVYDTTSRKSFECLPSAIEQAKGENADNSFCGILVANNRHQQSFFGNLLGQKKKKREVSLEEGEELKRKYGLGQFFEVAFDSNQMKKQILGCLIGQA